MIKVNWNKIKLFEKKAFAVTAMALLLVIAVASLVFCFFSQVELVWLKFLSALFLFLTCAFYIHIESRMLQIYLLLSIFDIGAVLAVLLPLPFGVNIFFFAFTLLLLLASVIICLVSGRVYKKNTLYDAPEPVRDGFYGEKNVMFFAPHEDDEINVFGGIIEQYVKNKSTVRIVFSTNGDFHGLGKMRVREALNVAKKYNIPADNVIFLGYSDSLKNGNGLHIYNCVGSEIISSARGVDKTYGNDKKAPFRSHAFTRKNFLSDVKDVIETYMPDVLYCCDYDLHPDHRAISLVFEEAMDSILKEMPDYHPQVFKGFAYSTAWDGLTDYYSLNAVSTTLKKPAPYMREVNVYDWKDRVRQPVAVENLSRVMQNSSSYMAMAEYSSQTATDHANSILNGDKIFWNRRTNNILCNAEITATSGDISHISSFKFIDSKDITKSNELPIEGMWVPDKSDVEKQISFKLPERRKISSIVLCENPGEVGHITDTVVSLGGISFNTGELKSNGAATIFEFSPVETDYITVQIKSYLGACSLNKIWAYEEPESENPVLIKVCNEKGNFCYDYIINKTGREKFSIYTYPQNTETEFNVSTEGEALQAEFDGENININCPPGESGILTVRVADNPQIYDKIRIRNIDDRERNIIALKQKFEHIIYSVPMQWDYYRGLLRRLATYFPFLNR